jgi:hypothetical protein
MKLRIELQTKAQNVIANSGSLPLLASLSEHNLILPQQNDNDTIIDPTLPDLVASSGDVLINLDGVGTSQ